MAQTKQIERLIRILQRLSVKNHVSVDELHRFFEGRVSKRTLQRDLVELSSANIPLTTRPGVGRQLIWSIEPGYLRFIPVMFQSREIAAATFVKTFATLFDGTLLEKDASVFFDKAKQLYPQDVVAESEDAQLHNMFGVTWTGYIDYRPFAGIIDQLLEAIRKRFVTKLQYKPTWKDSVSEFDAHPYMLLFHKGALYVVVHLLKYDKYVFLPVQRIRGVVVTEAVFSRKSNFSLEKLREGRIGIFGYEGQQPGKIVLKFDARIAEVIAERVWHPSQKMRRHRDGSLTLEMMVVVSDELRAWVASWLEYVTVVKPITLMEGTSD
ncbi:MAG: hypothetical protein DRP45_06105 [Candidatus Zixiibacteriota bacterium]|nr:MAG: hypothetical protein DRP45_06105 [candidate division Zixibacteria bacterium]